MDQSKYAHIECWFHHYMGLCVQCCLPEGVQIVLKGEERAGLSSPKGYSVILTGALWACLKQIVHVIQAGLLLECRYGTGGQLVSQGTNLQ
jgi:hypothetical protein